MSTNKHAIIRYHALDQCFSNPGRRYYIYDLVEACNKALFEFAGISDGVKKRQIYDDIAFMESEQGWFIDLLRLKDVRKTYYRYADLNFSIKKQPINELEINQLRETLLVLNRFKGMPQFEWMEEMLVRIESSFGLSGNTKAIVGFEQNPYLQGLETFSELFQAIRYQKVLKITYQGFKHKSESELIIHPYYLKQYNSRWFLFGYSEKYKALSNLPLDRIKDFEEVAAKYIVNKDIDFEEYFEDVVGATVTEEEPIRVLLKASHNITPYIETKPIHGSQKIFQKDDESTVYEYSVKINYEFISLLFSLGEEVNVIEPDSLKITIKDKARALLEKYL